MKSKTRKILFALLIVSLMLSSVVFVSAGSRSTYASLSADGWELQTIDSFVDLDAIASDFSFANFVGTFSGLDGCFAEFAEFSSAMADRRAEFHEVSTVYANMLIQLEALHTLFTNGVRNADRWVADTTIDLSAYENLWVKVDFETGNEYFQVATESGFLDVEVSFTLKPPETRALRQALMVPNTIWRDNCVRADLYQDISPMSAPFNSIGQITHELAPGNGTGFLVNSRIAATNAHVIHQNGITARNILFFPAIGSRQARMAWIDSEWMVNSSRWDRDQAFIVWNQAYSGNPTIFSLRQTTPSPDEVVTTSGFPDRRPATNTGRINIGSVTSTSFTVNPVTFSDGGMSGAPVRRELDIAMGRPNDVIGINRGRVTGTHAQVTRVTSMTITGLSAALNEVW